MKAVSVSDDIIYLNIGGQKVTTKRSTLCQVEGSWLASMFSGRWEYGLERDKDGYVFLDFNPQYFGLILDYLRAKKIETLENSAPIPEVAPEHMKNFYNLVRYLGLEEELKPKYVFKFHSAGVAIEENGHVIVAKPSRGRAYVLSDHICEDKVTRWKLKLESFRRDCFKMFVGLMKGDFVPSRDTPNRFSLNGLYGWFLDHEGHQIATEEGTVSLLKSYHSFKEGEVVELLLDCSEPKLSLVLVDGTKSEVRLPSSISWRLYIDFRGQFKKIRII